MYLLNRSGISLRIAADWREVRVRLPFSWQTRNIVGVIFGGSIYAAVDPFYMIMLMRNLGSQYLIWDKAAAVRFKKPARVALYARFNLDEAELGSIRAALVEQDRLDRVYHIDLCDSQGEVYAWVEKTIYIARR